jgi:hypothetical protein
MTRKQLHKALSYHTYIAARWTDGVVTGINCRIANRIAVKTYRSLDETETSIVGFYPVSFQEYIRIKTPYL